MKDWVLGILQVEEISQRFWKYLKTPIWIAPALFDDLGGPIIFIVGIGCWGSIRKICLSGTHSEGNFVSDLVWD